MRRVLKLLLWCTCTCWNSAPTADPSTLVLTRHSPDGLDALDETTLALCSYSECTLAL
jgi:hypothetical protein